MAALRNTNNGLARGKQRPTRLVRAGTSEVLAFAQRAYEKTGGATEELRRVYGAYLANQRKAQSKE